MKYNFVYIYYNLNFNYVLWNLNIFRFVLFFKLIPKMYYSAFDFYKYIFICLNIFSNYNAVKYSNNLYITYT